MIESKVSFPFQARYYSSGPIGPQKEVWIVLHGYGQLAQYFIRKFGILTENGRIVVAPEGLSRFYLDSIETRAVKGSEPRVGATWMTRENREMDIANYLTYLDTVYEDVREKMNPSRVTLLGFSQGAATAARWLMHRPLPADHVVFWAGVLPPDMQVTPHLQQREARVSLVYGNHDPYLTPGKIAEMNDICGRLGWQPNAHVFEGGHELDVATLRKVAGIN